jgi:hypothetical protein
LLPHEAVLVGGSKKGDQKKKPDPMMEDDTKEKDNSFLETTGCLMIFGRMATYDSMHRQKLARHEVYAVEPATPAFLRWSRSTITFDWLDHLESIPQLGKYPLMVDLIIGLKRLTKVLMDGGSALNIMYIEMLDAMGINRSCIRPTRVPYHDIVLGKQAKPLRKINLPVTFGTPTNYRMETLTFEEVGFHGTYDAILGRLCYAKFMAILNYTYLKFKMPGPCGVITVDTSFQRAYECEVECCELALVIITSEELAVIREETAEETPDSKRSVGSFEPIEGTKEVLIDPNSSKSKVVRIGSSLSAK